MNADGYLRRFIDFEYQLPDPPPEKYPAFLWEQFRLNDVPNLQNSEGLCLDIFSAATSALNLSLRDQQQCFTHLNVLLRTVPKLRQGLQATLTLFVAMKIGNPELWRAYRAGTKGAKHILEQLNGSTTDDYRFGDFLPDYLTLCSRFPAEGKDAVDALREQDRSGSMDDRGARLWEKCRMGTWPVGERMMAMFDMTDRFPDPNQ